MHTLTRPIHFNFCRPPGVVGYLTTYAGIRLPGLEDVPAGWAAWKALPDEVVAQMGMTWIFMEMANRDQTGNAEFVGDFRNGYLDFGWDSQSADWKKNKRTIELNQGRAAMMGLFGLMVHDSMGNVADILPLAK
jgi:Chlorophyll A-B binding protein